MNSIVALKTLPTEANAAAVKLLEDVLEQARKGDIAGVAIAFARPDGSIGAGWSATDNMPPVLAATLLMQHRYIAAVEEQAE